MALFDPSRGPPAIPHPGSYNANPVSLAAGLASMELLTREAVARLNADGRAPADGAGPEVFAEAGVPVFDHRARARSSAFTSPKDRCAPSATPRARMRPSDTGSSSACTLRES